MDSTDDIKHFQFSYPMDADHFLRRECPRCGLFFKLEAPADMQSLFPSLPFMQIETANQAEEDNHQSEKQIYYCPYCEHSGNLQDFMPQSLWQIIHEWIQREYILPQYQKMMGEVTKSFASSMGKNSLISMDFKYDTPQRKPRPIIGPELPDMNLVDLLCCKKPIKIKEGWFGNIICPFCASKLTLQ